MPVSRRLASIQSIIAILAIQSIIGTLAILAIVAVALCSICLKMGGVIQINPTHRKDSDVASQTTAAPPVPRPSQGWFSPGLPPTGFLFIFNAETRRRGG